MHVPNDVAQIALSHGQAKWLLSDVLHLVDGSASAFDAYLKFLRRNGVPFAANEMPGAPGTNVVYRYHHLMELALALVLRRQAILKGDVVKLLVTMRDDLHPLFLRAWLDRDSGDGSRVTVSVDDHQILKSSGLWLDLGLHYIEGGPLASAKPELLGPADAIRRFCTINAQRYFRDPIRISDIAAEIVRLAPEAPEVRRGRP